MQVTETAAAGLKREYRVVGRGLIAEDIPEALPRVFAARGL